ncbi:MAG: hypothetical protein WCQ50_17805 [Spirochaetota bacterium]
MHKVTSEQGRKTGLLKVAVFAALLAAGASIYGTATQVATVGDEPITSFSVAVGWGGNPPPQTLVKLG